MQIKKAKLKDIAVTLGISIAGALIVSLLYWQTIFFDNMENSIQDFMLGIKRSGLIENKENLSITKGNAINPDIVIIGIETKDLQEIGKWPWPRKIHAQLIDTLSEYKPKLIYFDMFFSEPETEHPEYDDAVRDAAKRAGNVYFNYYFLANNIGEKEKKLNILPYINKFAFETKSVYPETYKDLLPGVAKIYEECKGIGFINTEPESDGICRYIPLVIYYQNKIYPSVSILLAMDYLDISRDEMQMKFGNKIKFKNYQIPIDEKGRMFINYVGGSQSFQYFSYTEILNKQIEFDWKNKIVLVGFTSTLGLLDIKNTPFGTMPGVEILANSINQIINNDHKYVLNIKKNIYIILLLGLCVGISAIFLRHFKWLFVVILIAISYMLFAFYQFDAHSTLMSVIPNITAIILNFILIAVYHYIEKEKEAKKIQAIFASYVTPLLAKEILEHPEKAGLHGETREMTVLFSDIRNFTVFSENRTPREVVDMLNEYLSAMTNVVIKFNGILDKYVGDEIMAFWGAPILQPNHAELAVKCAIEMLHVLKKLQDKWVAEGKQPIGIGIGLNSGEMIVGNIGTEGKKMDYTVIGDNVNLGARVEALTRKYNYDLIITEFTYKHIKDTIQANELDSVTVKGKAKPVIIYGIKVEV
ncbi:adenylate/guanylate cyclase domain-containing protein [Candidatus Poribacteria bacterium]|nr:adenylate/guanylate cyclase domain-containing protein [Candidatus Poribacteria bacterium]